MRYGRTLVAGLGWAGTLGGLALCVLIFLSAYLAFDDNPPAIQSPKEGVVSLPSVPEAEVPRVPLARRTVTPRAVTTPRATAPVQTQDTGDPLGDAVDTITPPPPPGR